MMYYTMNLWIITMFMAIFVSQPDVSATQDVELNSTLIEGVAYNNQEIFFTCLVRGSNVLEWNSAEYIGQDGFPLQLLSFNGSDTNVSSRTHPSTYAVRRSVTREDGQPVIASDLRIIASTEYPVATITCGALSSKNITFQTLSSAPATQDVTFNVTTYHVTTTLTTTIPPTTEDFTKFDITPENQRSCTGGIVISVLVNVIVIVIILSLTIIIIKVRGKGSRIRGFEAAATNATSESPPGTKKLNDSQASGISPVPKPESSTKYEEKHKKILDVLKSGRELFDCMNLNKVPTESEELVPALKNLSDALSTGTPTAFKEVIKNLTDDLRVKKVSDEVLEESLKKLRETIQG